MISRLNIVILAAGKGSRMHSALPKVLHPLGGRPLLGHVIDAARKLDPAKLLVVYGYGGEAVPQAFADSDIVWVNQVQQLGTGHALQQAATELDDEGATLILYGDVPLISAATLRMLLDAMKGDSVGLLTVSLPDPEGYGRILRDAQGEVKAIVEHKDADEAVRAIREVNTGIMALPNARMKKWLVALRNDNAQGEFYLTDVIALAARDGVRVNACHPAHHWEVMGVNSAGQLAHLERLHQHEVASRLMERGVRLMDPKRIDVRGELICGRDVSIDINCIFEGRVVLGDNVTVAAHCVLRDVSVGEGTRIAPFSLIEEAQIGNNGRVGPFARLRPGTVLAEAVHVGNFVELKNSQVDRGSKINHLQLLDQAECIASEGEVQAVLDRLAEEIARILANEFPLVLAVMGGAVVFAGQLLPRLRFPLEFDYLHVTRYRGNTTGGEMEWRVLPGQNVVGRSVLVLDDILDEGETLAAVRDKLLSMGAARVWSAVLTDKNNGLDKPIRADFVGMSVPNRYVFGCGMDAYGVWRNLPAIYALKDK